jgi:TRAP-type C4-dicarboxylate transport system permease large subunit
LRYNPPGHSLPAGLPFVTQRRPIVAVLLALLLVLMQQGAQLHALTHDADRLQRSNEMGLQAPCSEVACALCALFAGGADAAAAEVAALPEPAVDHFQPPRAIAFVATAPPSPYQSRAPPSTL